MPDPTTILTYANQRSVGLKTALDVSTQRLAAAQTITVTEKDNLQNATTAFTNLEQKIQGIRQKLSAIPTPADGDLLLKQLEQAIIDSRAKQAEILGAQTALSAAQSEAGLAQSELADFSAQLTSAEALVKKVEPASKQRDAWIAALEGPLASIKTDATGVLDATKDPLKSAKKRIEDDIPATLLTRAKERRAAQAARIASATTERQAAEAAVFIERDKNGGAAGVAADRWTVLVRQEAGVGDFVNTAKNRLDQAKATLVQVANRANAPLTVEQKARMNAPAGSQLQTDREAAAVKEKGVADKRKDLDDKQQKLNTAILEAKAAPTDPVKQTAVGTAQGLVNTAKQDLKQAEDDYKVASEAIMNAWEAAVPDATWSLLNSYEAALEVLTATPNPAKLSTDLKGAEADYVKFQLLADRSANVLVDLNSEQAQRAAREENARQSSAASLFSVLRGDK
jgi:hypothetical protein